MSVSISDILCTDFFFLLKILRNTLKKIEIEIKIKWPYTERQKERIKGNI